MGSISKYFPSKKFETREKIGNKSIKHKGNADSTQAE